MGVVRAVCISEKKGTEKQNVHRAKLVADFGLKGDAHAGNWHRQVSLLSYEHHAKRRCVCSCTSRRGDFRG